MEKSDMTFDEALRDVLDDVTGHSYPLSKPEYEGYTEVIKALILERLPKEEKCGEDGSCTEYPMGCLICGFNDCLKQVKQNLGI